MTHRIEDRLRREAGSLEYFRMTYGAELMREAADVVERLRAQLAGPRPELRACQVWTAQPYARDWREIGAVFDGSVDYRTSKAPGWHTETVEQFRAWIVAMGATVGEG